MKTIIIPPPIQILDDNRTPMMENGALHVISFKKFLESTVLKDPKWGESMEGILAVVDIKIKLAADEEKLILDDDVWKKLLDIVSKPTYPYNPPIVAQLSSFLTAIRDAK